MIRLFICFIILLGTSILFAQTEKISSTANYQPKISNAEHLYLKMGFGSSKISNTKELQKALKGDVLAIDLVYTDYPKGQDLTKLNNNRLKNLEKLAPQLFSKKSIHWNIIAQTNCTDATSAKSLFHGFVISYRPLQDEETAKHDISALEKLLRGEASTAELLSEGISTAEGDYATDRLKEKTAAKDSTLLYCDGAYASWWTNSKDEIEGLKAWAITDKSSATSKKASVNWYYTNSFGELETHKLDYDLSVRENKGIVKTADGEANYTIHTDSACLDAWDFGSYTPSLNITKEGGPEIVKRVLERNKWKQMAITADLTGSMYMHTAKLLLWLKLNTDDDRTKQFLFFNDGDATPQHLKKIGSTGGLYDTTATDYKSVEELAYATMRGGGGGDCPENDIEALLKTIDLCPDCSEFVLIADNWAPIKDIELLEKVDKPIRVILCGAAYGINTQYLDLARKTGGSVHLIEQDITDLMELKEGQTVEIGAESFVIEAGKFVKLRKT